MFVGFFTSRVVLDKLGVVDYGINNVVAGFTSMFVFFRSSLSNATQRYLNIALGKKDITEATNIFSQHQTIYIIIALIVVVLAETFGLWFLNNKLVIPEDRMWAAQWVYQFTIISLFITILSVVYDSEIIAHEDMKIYSYVGIAEAIAKLLVLYLLVISPVDKLITYSFLLLLIALMIRVFYGFYCKRKYVECRYKFTWNPKAIREASAFIGWNTLGTMVWALNDQGVNVLLNMFFGPIVNAARGVAFHLSHTINNFGTNFFVSVRPQLVKSYAAGDYDYMLSLFYRSSKFSFMLMWALCFPIIINMDLILSIWLREVPDYTSSFARLVLVYSLINILNNPIWSLSMAVGKLKYYILIGSSVFLSAFPIAYIFLKNGYAPESVFIILIIVRALYIFTVLNIIKRYVPIKLSDYFKRTIIPIIIVVTVSVVICVLPMLIINIPQPILLVYTTILNLIILAILGLDSDERKMVIQTIRQKIKKAKK